MRKSILFLSLVVAGLLFISLSSNEVQAKDKEPVPSEVVTTAGLNVRTEPSIESDRVAVLPENTKITVSEYDDFWSLLELDGTGYFVASEFLTTEQNDDCFEVSSFADLEEIYGSSQSTQTASQSELVYTSSYFRTAGVISWGGYTYTWYSQNTLPGGGLAIPGRHVNENNYVVDGDGYIVLASQVYPKGTVIPTPFGNYGIVRDYNPDNYCIDVYTNF